MARIHPFVGQMRCNGARSGLYPVFDEVRSVGLHGTN